MKLYEFEDEQPKKILVDGGIIAFPTETVFGLGVRFDRKDSFDRLIKVKERPSTKPFTMMVGDVSWIYKYSFVDERQKRVIDSLLPGELTVILKKRPEIPSYVTLGGDTLGFRVPGYDRLRKFLLDVNIPLLVPSANKSGFPPAKSVEEIENVFGDEIDGVINGTTGDSIPSTVVLLTGEEPVVLRQGKITIEQINKAFYNK